MIEVPGTYSLSKNRNQTEKRWVLLFALLVVLLTTLPYWIGFQNQGTEWHFTGFIFGVEDGNTYIGKMLRGSQGDWLFRSPYTAVDQRGAFTFLPYLLLGKITAPPNQHDQLVVVYHLFRMLGGFLAVFATYDFLALYIKDRRVRRVGLVWITFGGGLGWLLILLGQKNWLGDLPIDFYSPETFGFLGTYGIAHLPWARAFFLWGLRSYLLRGGGGIIDDRPLLKIADWHPGILWLLTGIAQPITGIVIGAVAGYHVLGLAAWQLFREIKGKTFNLEILKSYTHTAICAGLVALPLVVYNIIAFSTDSYLTVWVAQSRIPSPHLLHYLAAFGIIIPFVVRGVMVVLQKNPQLGLLLVSWVILTPVLITIPFSLQRRLVEGLWVALVTLALVAFERSRHVWFRRSYLLGIFCFPTTFLLLAGGFATAVDVHTPVFHPADEVSAFRYLADSVEDGAVVLSAYDTGNALPAWAPVFVVIGHRPESAGISEIAPLIEAFFKDETQDENRLLLLEDYNVDYVFWGPVERELGDWNPAKAKFLELVFQAGGYEIYHVIAN